MSSFELTYRLFQQSPLIHFQYDEPNATLRVTEVKPKLDRYLSAKYAEQIPASWRIQSGALNYKMQIRVYGHSAILPIGRRTDYDIYYGSGATGKEKKALSQELIFLTVICLIPELREKLEESIEEFFILHNFGAMQNKGFGSYLAVRAVSGYSLSFPSDKKVADLLKSACGAAACYAFPAGAKPFKRIRLLYSLMKSGVNLDHGQYQRSLLFLYMHERYAMGNEKEFLKEQGIAPSIFSDSLIKKQREDALKAANSGRDEKHAPYYVRAFLGLGDCFRYLNSPDQSTDKTVIAIENPEIRRLGSCIFFKIIGETVYMAAKRMPAGIYGQRFTFRAVPADESAAGNDLAPCAPVSLCVPTLDEVGETFIDDFLAFCCEKFQGGILDRFDETRGCVVREVE